MAKFILLAMNGPTPDGDAEAFSRWYANIHIPDLLAVPGIKSARRFETVRGIVPGSDLWPTVALYEIEADDLSQVSAGMQKMRPFHEDFDRSKSAHIFAREILEVSA